MPGRNGQIADSHTQRVGRLGACTYRHRVRAGGIRRITKREAPRAVRQGLWTQRKSTGTRGIGTSADGNGIVRRCLAVKTDSRSTTASSVGVLSKSDAVGRSKCAEPDRKAGLTVGNRIEAYGNGRIP